METGRKTYDEFQKLRLEENEYKDFNEKQPKLQLNTFSDLKIQTRQKFLEKRCHSKSRYEIVWKWLL